MQPNKDHCRTARYRDEIPERVYERLLERFDVNEERGCWLYNWSRNNVGYGAMSWREHGQLYHLNAHVVMYRLAYLGGGPIPEGYHVHHQCHERACVNPTHLELNTAERHRDYHHRYAR